ncbi:acetyltransferase [Chryseobacterium piperi]|uniref:Acetyltransferase n=1 Tax=Chryseobacterium piperi TaxID=558152 RepID=A0A086BAY9_9FLAO|nr:GNAT family N-acetyltransferase [Chryseobacterium piperi]ASW75851.1 N-acetyltransferase [Chryseobacterium piperi]KFF26103.1 acetyltransferase [Chryseobacterium piperi]
MKIREATENDLEVLLEFEQGIVESERLVDKTLKEGEIHYYDLSFLIRSEDALLVVVEKGNEIVASEYALIKEYQKDYTNFKKYAYLGFMFVKPEHRGEGINQLIVERLIEWSKNKGMSEIRLDVYEQNEPAVRAYEKAGFEPLLLTMRLKT